MKNENLKLGDLKYRKQTKVPTLTQTEKCKMSYRKKSNLKPIIQLPSII